jgi:hypothetical protein
LGLRVAYFGSHPGAVLGQLDSSKRTYCEQRTNVVHGSHQPPIPKDFVARLSR